MTGASGTSSGTIFMRALFALLVLPGIVAGVVPVLIAYFDTRFHSGTAVGFVVLAVGLVLLLWCVRDFFVAGKGTLAPWDPPKHLVVVGLYRCVRNPMYLAVLTIVWGWSLTFGSVALGMYLVVLAIAFHLRVVFYEEPRLQRQFGAEWSAYRASVRRWIPGLPPRKRGLPQGFGLCTSEPKTKRTVFEIGAVIATALLHPVFVDVLHQRALFIGLALGVWVCYLGVRFWHEKNLFRDLGFRREGLVSAFAATSLFAVPALLLMWWIARAHRNLVFTWHMLVLLGLYPVWGLVQQLLVQGIFVRPVTAGGAAVMRKLSVIVLAAVLFAAVHLPDVKLAAATCLVGAVFTTIYLRWRNLWPLGLYHGWLGVLFYYWVLGRDPLAEIFGGTG